MQFLLKNQKYYGMIFGMLTSFLLSTMVAAAPGDNQATIVKTIVVKKIDWQDYIEALGTLNANESINITSNVVEHVAEVHFKDGEKVEKNQQLMILEKAEEEARLRALQAKLVEFKAAYSRVKNLESKKLTATATLDQTIAQLHQTEADIDAIQAQINDRVIRAPFSGNLGFRQVSLGALVQPGDIITTLDDISQMKIDFSLPETVLDSIALNLEISVDVDAFSDQQFSGYIETINSRVDPLTRSFLVRGIIKNPDEILKPGLLAKVKIYQKTRQVLVIPEVCLLSRGKQQFVYVVKLQEGQKIATLTKVDVGESQLGQVEILSGLDENDEIVTHGVIKLRDGQLVNIKSEQ